MAGCPISRSFFARCGIPPLSPRSSAVSANVSLEHKTHSMHAQNTARSLLRQLIDGAPQPSNMEIMWMQPYYQQVSPLPPQKFNDCFHRLAFDQMIFEFDAVTLHLDACFFLKLLIDPQPILLELSRQGRIADRSKRCIRRKRLRSGDGMQ